MPSSELDHNHYPLTHRRKPSQQPDQARVRDTSPRSSNGSRTYLPTSTYTLPTAHETKQLSISTAFPRRAVTHNNAHVDRSAAGDDASPDPREFYREYNDPFAEQTVGSLKQGGNADSAWTNNLHDRSHRRKSSLSSVRSNGAPSTITKASKTNIRQPYQASPPSQYRDFSLGSPKSTPNLSTISRTRKSSFKDLVAKFDNHRDEPPPLPTDPHSRSASRAASPIATTILRPASSSNALFSVGGDLHRVETAKTYTNNGNNGFQEQSFHSQHRQATDETNYKQGSTQSLADLSSDEVTPRRRPLFGEIVPSASATSLLGYGISQPLRKTGSEDSPVQGSNPIFLSGKTNVNIGLSPSSPTAWYLGYTSSLDIVNLDRETQQSGSSQHRRTRSDLTHVLSRQVGSGVGGISAAGMTPLEGSRIAENQLVGSNRNSPSRIPIRVRRHSYTSDSGRSSRSSRTNLAMDKTKIRSKGIPVFATSSPIQSSPTRKARSPLRIKSPGRRDRGQHVQAPEKSPLLRANIIAPPPKVSPPLRSSRPRLPVSSASTAASRAKMAEKLHAANSQHNHTRYSSRRSQRPPELSNIDLEARRQKITQAFNQTVREEARREELAAQRRRKALERAAANDGVVPESKSSVVYSPGDDSPVVTVDDPSMGTPNTTFETPTETPGLFESGLRLDTSTPADSFATHTAFISDSPTLGNLETTGAAGHLTVRMPSPTQHPDAEPSSAVTAETDGTSIENEPQAEFTRPKSPDRTVLSTIMGMRSASPQTSRSAHSMESADDSSDLADQESIQIMLRSTLYENEPDNRQGIPEEAQSQDVATESWQERCSAGSWTSSTHDRSSVDGYLEPIVEASPDFRQSRKSRTISGSGTNNELTHDGWLSPNFIPRESARSTMDGDIFSVVHLVLQQHSTSGGIDRDLLDATYQRVLSQSAQLKNHDGWDAEKVTQACLAELDKRKFERSSKKPTALNLAQSNRSKAHEDPARDTATEIQAGHTKNTATKASEEFTGRDLPSKPTTAKKSKGHHYRASLDSAEDFANTSPSLVDWMKFAIEDSPTDERDDSEPPVPPPKDNEVQKPRERSATPRILERPKIPERRTTAPGLGLDFQEMSQVKSPPRSPPPRPPSHSPPPPPTAIQSIGEVSAASPSPSNYSRPPSSNFPSATFSPTVPRRFTSLSQANPLRPRTPQSPNVKSASAIGFNFEYPAHQDHPRTDGPSKPFSPTPEQRKLIKRRHVIKELIDTEASFGRDIKVVDDIYKGTSSSCLDLSIEDVKVLFGNSEQIVQFSMSFLDTLKQAGKAVYVMPKSQRFQSKRESKCGSRVTSASTAGTSASDDNSPPSGTGPEILDADKDRQTFIGEAFKIHLADMEKVYTEYLRNHDAANRKLQSLQQNPKVEIWLKECRQWASDLTSAWNLDSLLVKPVQRILKYPLLLTQLLESTPEDHPDHSSLKTALRELTDVSIRINDMKKHAELVEQVLSRKRKDSDVRTGISKAFGRRTEKLKQHVGISEMVEDRDYTSIRDRYAENLGQLIVVCRDVRSYHSTVVRSVQSISDFGAAIDAWIDVGHSAYPELESKCRQYSMAVREIVTTALPEHLGAVQRSVIEPMHAAIKMLESVQKDPRGLLQKRDKKLIDYARFKNMKDRGEKLDRKTVERMEQWEALNREAKERMSKLIDLTGNLVEACQRSFVQIQMTWLTIWQRKLSTAVGVSITNLAQIAREWQEDFDFQEATALSLGICNGSLLTEAVNLVNFLTPSTTYNGDDSPRQSSWNSGYKRSISLNSDGSPALAADFTRRHSGTFTASPMVENPNDLGFVAPEIGRIRATSSASGRAGRVPEITTRTTSLYASMTGNSVPRPATSAGRSGELSPGPPRLSIEAPSISIGSLNPHSPSNVSQHALPFPSATSAPPHHSPSPAARGSGVFSSAMPMSDSPRDITPQVPEDPDCTVLFLAASVYEFNIDRSRREAGFPYLTYVAGEIFDVIGERGELWLAKNQDDPQRQVGWIWNKHFAKLTGT